MGVHDTHSGAQPDHNIEDNTMTDSRFDSFDGYYSVRFSGIEFARFAPSPRWSEYAKSMENVPDFSYVFVSAMSDETTTVTASEAVEGRARLYDIDEYEAKDTSPGDRAFWLNDTAKSAVGLLYLKNRHQPHLLLTGSITVTREDDFMVARITD